MTEVQLGIGELSRKRAAVLRTQREAAMTKRIANAMLSSFDREKVVYMSKRIRCGPTTEDDSLDHLVELREQIVSAAERRVHRMAEFHSDLTEAAS